jgi:GntR family transcriptional repressor for pyruvate dehydrogenase complex
MYKAIRTSRLYEQIVEQIEKSVRDGALKAGDQLPAERELALQFGVSRTAVREAVKALSEKGLVEAYSGRGTFVTGSRQRGMRQSLDRLVDSRNPESSGYLVEVREIIEPEFSALAATRIDEQHLTLMREAVAVMDRSMRDPDTFIEADLDFHLSLAEAVANPIVLALLDSIVAVLREQRSSIFGVEGGPERGQFHHKRILEAIERRDPAAAREAMRNHLEQVRADSSAATSQRTIARRLVRSAAN